MKRSTKILLGLILLSVLVEIIILICIKNTEPDRDYIQEINYISVPQEQEQE